MTKYYLAARYSKRLEIKSFAEQLEKLGHEITARWLTGEEHLTDEQISIIDTEDVVKCDAIICFTEIPRGEKTRGGRHVECGIAIGLNKDIILIGPQENVFYHLPKIKKFNTWQDFYKTLVNSDSIIEENKTLRDKVKETDKLTLVLKGLSLIIYSAGPLKTDLPQYFKPDGGSISVGIDDALAFVNQFKLDYDITGQTIDFKVTKRSTIRGY